MFDSLNEAISFSDAGLPRGQPETGGDFDRFPLSFAQQRIWFLDRLMPGEPIYNIPGGVWLRGELDVRLLSWSLSAIVDRHEVLRTAFVELEGEPLQVPLPELDLPLSLIDVSPLPPVEREREVRRRAAEHARTSFDLSQPPLLRVSLLRLGEREHLLLLVIHHIIADGWSMGVLVRELTDLYRVVRSGGSPKLEKLPVQYADYAAWQREWLQGKELEDRLEYWRGRLGGRLPVLNLPTFRPRPAQPSSRGAQSGWVVDSAVAAELSTLGRRQGATLFMTLLAAFQTFLHRVSGEDDLIVGTPVAGRLRPELEGLIGCFVNTLVLRTDLSGNPSFQKVLERVRQLVFEAFEHEDLPFEKLVEALQPDREFGRTPLFQIMFTMQTAELPRLGLPGLEIELAAADAGSAKFDLSLEMSSAGGVLRGVFEFATDLFEAPTIARLQVGFERLLAAVAANPGRAVADLSLLSPEERFQVVAEWNDTAQVWPWRGGVHRLVSEQARRTPGELAVATEGGDLSYEELEERAERLAGYLRSIGVGREVVVGVAVRDVRDLSVTILAIWKAGGAYLPLDSGLPSERLAYMVKDSCCAILVTRGEELSSVAASASRWVRLDRDAAEIARSATDASRDADSASLAYVIYTSGSTGRPKGVLATHGGLANFCLLVRDRYGLHPKDRVLQFASPSFDVFLEETIPTWLAGGTVVPTPERLRFSFHELANFLQEYRVTVANLPASYWHNLVSELQAGAVTLSESLRLVVVGSEAVSVGRLAAWQAQVRVPIRLLNAYGPTENTIGATLFEPALSPTTYPGATLPVGRPNSNVHLHLLDGNLQPVGIGFPGEVCLGGAGVTRGYLGRPDLTAERFIPDPFRALPGGRLYRTGDLARFLPDGNLDFLGRSDHQVKVRGFRIELGEIEAVVEAHPAVQEAAVVVAGSRNGNGETDEQLVAYVVARSEAPAGALEAVRMSLREKLPIHMIPSFFVPLDRLPWTPNGKIDRKLLAEKPLQRPGGAGKEILAPRNEAERALAAIWSEVLGVEQVAADDHFFALGGHSLLVAKLLSRVRERVGVELPLRSVFEAPVLADLAERISSLLPSVPQPQAPPLVRLPRNGSLPLSFAQQRLWFLDLLEPGSSVYNIPDALRVSGRLRSEVWDRALSEVVRRHEALRTTFFANGGEPVQVIGAPEPVTSIRVDLRSMESAEQEAEARRLMREEARAPFNLERGPLLRSTLVRLADEEWLLLLTMHHIVSDAWSAGVLIHEMRELYLAFSTRRPSPLLELPIQYADFAVWQRGLLRGEVLEREIAHWRGVLADAPQALDLPTDYPRPAVKSFRGRRERLEIGTETARSLADLASREDVTLFMAILAAFQVFLFRYSNARDFSVGTPISGRNRLEVEGLIGFFVNTLVLRADLSGEPDFLDLLRRVRARVLDAYSHQDVPFELLVDDLAPRRDLSRSSLFQVLLVMQNVSLPELDLPGVSLAHVPLEDHAAKFDLTLTLGDTGGRLQAGLQYATDLFDASTALRMLRHFGILLEAITADPCRPVESVPLLASSERHQVVLAWNDTARGGVEETLHGLFAAQARRTPEWAALRFEGEEMSFGDLDRRSNQVACFLRHHGVGPDVLVGLCMERSLDLVVGVLGILKAGGGYVPLDPGYPAERLAYMLADSGAPVLLGQERLLDRMPESGALRVLVDADWERIAAYGAEPLAQLADAADLACVLYTSGSTGRPKGVMDSHGSVINQLRWLQSIYRLDGTDRVLQKTPISWDVSLWELFWPLTSGACMVLAQPGGHQDPRYLATVIAGEGITTVHFVPSMLRIFLESESGESCGSLRRVVSSGEALGLDLEERFFASFTVDLNNMYGPGESARTTLWRCERGNTRSIAPIGRPTHDTQVYVLDRRLEPAPIGVTGEIWVASQSMARGYHRRPELTAEKFLPNPFGSAGTRLYRTGDLGRTLADGTLEFLGRIDHQVKIRGVRIELGEIETALGQHPKVSDAVVVARSAGPGEKRLAAYVVAEGGPESVGIEELREHLRSQLPEYMVPESWVMLESLPLAPNGKADRDRLPAPQWVTWQRDYVAPRTPVEDLLATMWSQLLGVERVGVHDSFFELGGHSLLATQVASRVRSVFAVEMPLRAVFERPLLSDLAAAVADLLRRERGPAAPPLVPVPRSGPLPLSFAQQRLWFLERLQPGGSAYNLPNALRVTGELRPVIWDGALSEIVRRHETLRTTFAWGDGGPVQAIGPPERVTSALGDLRSLEPPARETEARRLVLAEGSRSFDLERGPMLRSRLVRLADEEWLLLLTMHHIASDGWSTGILITELRELYASLAEGRPARLPELPVQYADFAMWQRGWLRGEILEREVAHWHAALADAPPTLDLPTDHPRPALQSFQGGHELLEIDPAVSRSFTEFASRQGATLFMGVLAAFQVLLSRYSHSRDFSVGSPISGRNRLEIEGLIGFFVNTLVLRADLSGEPDALELLRRVRSRILDAYTHQDVPFELLVEDLSPRRDLSRSPLFQVLLLVQTDSLPELDLPGLSLASLPVESRTAKFDLTLSVVGTDHGLRAGLEYASDLFEAATARRLLENFGALLGAMAFDPRRPVGSLPLLAVGERQQLLVEWNDTASGEFGPGWIHERFEAQVRRTSEAVALIWGDLRLTYGELNRRANRLAHHLRRLGVGPESRVGISLARSPEMIVSLLATLKAGGGYVPLDPTYPSSRLSWILEDARIEALLTRGPFLERLPGFTGRAFCFEADSDLSAEPEVDPAGWRFDRQLAYVLYTSGSTGRPKGVLIEHRSAVALLDWALGLFAAEELSGVLAATSINFDLSVFEIFLPLVRGGAVILAENALALPDLAAAGEVTLVNTVPSAMAELVRSGGLPPSVRTVSLAGEPLPRTLVDDLYRVPTLGKVYNLYGPTEDTTYSTWALLRRGESGAPSIGRPLAGSRLYLVDGGFQAVPLGAAGEIVLGGFGLARGYLGRPELTAERFVPDPFAGESGGRLYRTGDLGKLLPDGRVAFLGRIDHQVKVRGFRIELGEIEAVLREHPEVQDAVLIARGSAGGTRLLAYAVLGGGGPASPEAGERLRRHVAERLPAYMIPSAFVVLEALPRTPNGKVDRGALPEPGMAVREAEYVPPRTPVEELIADVWAEILDVPRVGTEDNFFELGGHSLLATRVMVRLRDAFGADLPLRRLFEAPTVAGLARQVEGAWMTGPSAPPLRRRSIAEPRLSFAQARLWFLDQLQPETAAYNLPAALRLEGVPRVEALRLALSEIVRRHEVLRTTFALRGGEPTQVVGAAAPLPLPVVDLSALPGDLRGESARRLTSEESRRPFDLAAGPVIRASLLRLAAADHVLRVTLHHVVSDGWSLGLLVDEVSSLYPAFLAGRPSPLPELAVQYADFAVWQREWLQGEVLERQLDWWREHLKGAPGLLDLPADRPRPAVRSSRGGRVPVEIPPGVARDLAALGRARGATPFMLYLAAFQALLGRLSVREDLVVGTPIAGRVRAELEPLIGLFLNTLALRGDLSGDPSFGEHLTRVREASLGAYAHQDLPFERLVDELAPERNLTHAPVFQVLFVFQNAPQGRLELPGLTWSRLETASGSAKFDLTLTLFEVGDGLSGQLGFHRDLFDEATVRRWAGHLGVLLEGLTREPAQRLSERDLMSAAERHQVVLAWNDTTRGGVEETLHGLFAAQARRTPEWAALRFEGEEMSFGDLDRRSNQVACFLRHHGVGPDVLVGLCMERSLELVLGVLGILKAGGGYVPLDPGYPADRLAYMLADSGAPVLLGQERLLDRMPESGALRVLVDADWERIAAHSSAPLAELAQADHLACVLYTSGSTGRPKGVMDSHGSVINQLRWLQSTYRLDGTDRVLQKTPISWDVSLWELFWPLTSGACMVLAQPGGHQDPRYLATVIAGEGITTVHFVPSMLRIFLESESGESCGSLRRVVSSGEALGLDLEEKFFASFTVDLNNMYGPGESARTTLWRCERDNTRSIAPIGRPTHDTQVYVLDRRLAPVPIGVTGEIWVASQSMARGYHRRPELTAEKFLPNPFGSAGTRLYRTGDLGRTLADGTLEFLGRIDHQVKIRGVRIELGEIETALGQHPKVSDAVVVARSAGPGEKRLAAYVVAEGGPESVGIEELREHLRSELPEYMVPESWVMLESLPLAPNGKADRDRLPEPQWVTWQRDYVAPRTPVEDLLATMWSEVLGVERVGVHDSFFELGGHSLLATQVASRVRSVFAVEMPLRTVFERPLLSDLAAAVADLLRCEHGPAAPPLVPVPRSGPLPLSFAQQRLWFLERLQPGGSAYNLPNALRVTGELRPAIWDGALSEIVRRHETLRTTFAWGDGGPVQAIGPPEPVTSALGDLRSLEPLARETEARRLVLAEGSRSFDLERGPMLRSRLVRMADEEWLLLLTMHHIASDGWSTGILITELRELYASLAEGRPARLPELPVQYADFAMWQRGWLRGEILDREVAHWHAALADSPPTLDLPTDHPRPALQSFRGGHELLEIDPAVSRSFTEFASRQGATLFMGVLAAFQVLLSRYSHSRDFSVGSPISGRNRLEIEGLIGFFVNTLVLRADLSGEPDALELLRRVRSRILDAYTHQDVPFELLVEDLSPRRDLSRSPLFQVLLLVQTDSLPELDLPGVSLASLPVESRTAKFDLTLSVVGTDHGLRAGLEYASDLFEAATARRLLEHFGALLGAMASDPRRPLGSLPLLAVGERQQLLVEWNDTASGACVPGWIHERFEAQVRRTPEAVALIWGDLRLTYGELNRRANRLAHHLRRLGVGPESRVGISLERSPEMIVSLLATLKAGGGYVPLDPTYPSSRLSWILEDARIEALLTRGCFLERLPGFTGRAFCFEADSDRLSAEPEVDPAGWRFDRQLAYVLYTSGSTGRPKGVLIEHRSAVALLDWASGLFAAEELSGVLAATSINFDLSVFEIFLPLVRGGAVILAENALALPDLAAAGEVTLVNTVPSAMAELVRSGGLPPSVRTVSLAGEPLPRTLVDDLYRVPTLGKVYNLYGPTEDTTYSTWALLRRGESGAPSIGRPLAGSRLYLVDGGFQAVPLGAAGEIVLGGFGLARGYLGRPELTAERFVPDPFAGEPGGRLYRTGDLGKLLPDGRVAFLGRIDHQVKVRGFRIELGEIEAVLREHPEVEDAVLIARGSAGGTRLLAYAVLKGAGPASPESGERLRRHVAERLPAYMIPSAFVVLEALPRTPNDKVDRGALPEPGMAVREAEYVPPRTPVEELIADVWAEILDVPRVGTEDNFFELGGHSLLATRVMVRLRDAFGADLPLRRLFEAPTVAGLARQVEGAWMAGPSAPPLRRRSIAEPRLSFAQARLWFLDQLQPETAAYNLPAALRLEGVPRVEALRLALSEIVRRHEVLRTTFALRGGEPTQVVGAAAPLPLPVVDLSALPGDLRGESARRLTSEESRRPFDLAAGPVIRASLLRLAAADHVLRVTLHHVVSDGWSLGLLVDEVSSLYPAFLAGKPSPLPELAVQYADFAVWQREWLQGEVLERQLDWWREHLKGAPGLLDLPADRPRPAVRSSRGGRVPVEIPPRVARDLAALGRARGATPFMLYLAAFQTLLGRLSVREDLVVGTPIAGRVRAELEPLIGLFLNTLALRGDLSGDPSFGEHLARVREASLGAYAHQDLPFERLVDELAPERNLTHAPVFQVLFVFQNAPQGRLELPGLRWSRLETASGSAKFDLTLTLFEVGDGLSGQLGFHRDLFDEATVRRWAGHLGVLLEGLAREPAQRLSERDLMSAAERHQVVLAWNDTARGGVEETLHGLFAAQARRTPEWPALRFEGEEMSFGDLDRRSNQVACFLRRHGVSPDILVGLCMERSLDLVVGVLGILKAGGGYVPLDPGYPAERLAYMLADSGAPVLLGQERLLDRMPESGALRVLVDADWERIAAHSSEPLAELADAADLACVLYTSGSTGRPKGVMDSHRSVINQLRWLQSIYRLDGTDRVLQKTPISWDVSLWELFWPLTSGACMVLAQPGGHQDPRYLATVIAGERITTVHFVPSMLRIFLESESGESCGSLRRVVSSGEALGLDLEERFFASFTVDLNNMYGPGESARTTLWRCERGNTRSIAPIGRPTHDTQVYVLDRRLEPVPIGVTGEIWVASQSMARGYHRRPELTAEKFLPNPFGSAGTRLYRTGDLGRTLADGTLEFLGRIDHQVKIRGVRIELGEIETALGQHPKVSDAVVVARSAGPGEKRLAAYVVAEGGPESVGIEELREHLRSQLPEYMVPESWVMLAELPLAPNGKADRDRLPEPQWVTWQRDYVAPRTPVEDLLATMWSQLLGVERVGVHDSFFELGGHSLLATQVASRVRSVFAVEMPLRTVFERPLLADLASAVAELLRCEHGSAAPPLVPVPRSGSLPLSFAQQRLWFLHQLDSASPAYNLSLPLRLRGGLDVVALSRALDELVRRQESLRTEFEVRDRQVLQRIAAPWPVSLPLIDLGAPSSGWREKEIERLTRAEAARSFDLARGPMLRTLLVRLGESDHVFLLSQHHIVSDGWSTGIFIREMSALYQAFTRREPSPLPELPLQYADFAVWQRTWLSGSVLEGEVRWWREQLQGAPALLELPLDRPRPPVQTFSGGHAQRGLPPPLATRLLDLARREGATAYMALLALFEALLLRHTGQNDFVLGTPIANRNRSETEGLIGFFVNTLALRCDLTGSPSFRRLLARVRETTLGAFTHQDLPFEKLVEELQPERSLSLTPLFQVMFSLSSPAGAPSIPGLTLEALPLDNGTSKFDLSLFVEERAGTFTLSAGYNSDLFLAATVERLLEHFEVLLEGAVADPEQPVTVLPLMSAAESHQVVQGWNATAAPFPESSCLHELFDEQVRRSPDAVALEYGEERLTYAELHRRAGVLACRLRGLGIGTDSLAGISAERSIEMVVGLLGILKAGGAYVPLDPSYPADRLAYMLEDSGVGVLLTQSWLEAGLPSLPGRLLLLDNPALFAGTPEGDLNSATPSSLAYAIYTSGSTGRPKGAGVPHCGIVNRLCWMQSAYPLTAEDRVLQKTPFSFDVSVWELFWPLITGARLVMAPPGAHQDPARLSGLIRSHGITTLHFVPSMLQVFLEQKGLAEDCRSVRHVFASGEALPFELKERFLSRLLDTQLRNLYGPTEASVEVTFHACELGGERRIVPIGRPIDNTSILLLDPEGQPVPIGVPGELHIGGVNLARGYLDRPELTAERFVPDPFSGEPGTRLYRTGDLARFRPDGEVEFLGRLDHQIKLHGVRIELGEIEAALGQHPGVRETVVVARQDGGDTRLVAYLVPGGDAAEGAAPDELRAFLRERLPEAMIPSAFVILPGLPLSPSGKVDRKALPVPQWSERQAAFVAPSTPTEQALAGLWTEILDMPGIGAEDSFFALGGTSLQAAILVISVESRLGARVPLAALFEAPTVAGLARYLETRFPAAIDRLVAGTETDASEGFSAAVQAADSPLAAIQPKGAQPPLFCVHPVGGTVFCYLPLARALGPDQPVYGLQSTGFGGGREPLSSIEEMAETYLEALRGVQPRGPYRLAGWSMGGAIAYEMARRLNIAGEEVALLLLLDSSVPQGAQDLDESDLLTAFAADLVGLTGKSLELEPAALREIAPDRREVYFLEQARAVGALPSDVGAQQLEGLFKVFRANLKALRSWVPLPSRLGEVVLARPEAKLARGDGDGGWEKLIGRKIRIWPVQGDHFSLLREPAASGLAQRLGDYLNGISTSRN